MNARYYNPTTGTFLTQDSYSGNPYDPWTQHLYTYCGNNPVNFIDPTGHKVEENEIYGYKYFYSTVTGKGYSSKKEALLEEKKAMAKTAETIAKALDPTSVALDTIYSNLENNYTEFIENPTVSSCVKWITLGSVDIDRMINPENPLSLDHWVANIQAATFVFGLYQASMYNAAVNAEIEAMTAGIPDDVMNTTLYRSMSSAEYESFVKTGDFTSIPGAMESKWFSTTYEGAQYFLQMKGNDIIMSIEVPNNALQNAYYSNNIDGTGPGYCFDIDYLNSLF